MYTNGWSKKYNECLNCKTILYRHKAKGLCEHCYQILHKYPKEQCSICGSVSKVHKRENGNAICRECYKRPAHQCSICGKHSAAALKLSPSKYICMMCYTKYYRERLTCTICGKNEIIAVSNEKEKICIKCYSPSFHCSLCGRDIKSPYKHDDYYICARCYERIKLSPNNIVDVKNKVYRCSICGLSGNVQRLYNDGSTICQNCYNFRLTICVLCNNPLSPVYSHINGCPYCRGCYYKTKTVLYVNNSSWSQSFVNFINAYIEEVCCKKKWESLFHLLNQNTDMLDYLNKIFIDPDYSFELNSLVALFDTFPKSKTMIKDLMLYMSENNIITDFNTNYILFDNLLKTTKSLPSDLSRVILSYKEFLNSTALKYRERGWTGENTKLNYYTCYLYLQSCIRFSTFINRYCRITSFFQIDNSILDSYIQVKSYEKCNLKHFIDFLNENRLTFKKLSIHSSYYYDNLNLGLDEITQSKILITCIEDNNIPLRNKVLVILMLIFGIKIEELKAIYRSQFIIGKREGQVFFIYRNVKYELPVHIANIIEAYITTIKSDSDLLFGGKYYKMPLSISSIHKILRKFGTTSKELRYTAIHNAFMNGIFQPSLLTKLFGLHPYTAVKYYERLQGAKVVE